MTEKSRRRLLQGLAITLPAAWTRPVVESVVLPAHAQASPGACSAEEGCYVRLGVGSFFWPGGAGPETVDAFAESSNCEGDPTDSVVILVASDGDEASERCPEGTSPDPFETDPPAPEGCSFFECLGDD